MSNYSTKIDIFFKFFLKLMWPIRIFFLCFWLYQSNQLGDVLTVLSGFAVAIGLVFWLYSWADQYEKKNIAIYLANKKVIHNKNVVA